MTGTRQARISAVGSALPERVVPNAYFESILDTSDEWIRERTGIRARRFAGPNETTATLAADAADRALAAAGVDPGAVDLLIVGTITPDRPMPSAAAFVQARMGMACPAFDLNAACAGFVYGLSLAAAQIQAGAADRVLVIGSETLSRVLDMTDRSTCVLFGDGAGAALLEPSEEPGVMGSRLELDGGAVDVLTIPAGGSAEPASAQTVAAGRHLIQMPDGRVVFKRAVVGMAEACSSLLEKAGMSADDVSVVVPHQANARIMLAVADRLGLPHDKLFVDIAEVGNTSAASIPIALDHAWRAGRIGPGDVVLTTAFGAGLAWGANLIRWTAPAPAAEAARG
ncbi:MAG TPA: beta-ketoacyl-ACP synthase III [Actinomycetota bacterium]